MVGLRLRERRVAISLTMDQVCARVADVTAGEWVPLRQDIYKIETGVRAVTDLEVLALADALDTQAGSLFEATTG